LTSARASTTKTTIPEELYEQLLTARLGNRVRVTEVRQIKGQKAARVYYTVDGSKGAHWDMPNNDLDSVIHAICERMYYVKLDGEFQPPPQPKGGKAGVFKTLRRFSAHMGRLARQHGKVAPVSDLEFLMNYSGQKKGIYERAIETLKTRPLEVRDGRIKIFTKDEFLKAGGAPRAIQPRSPRFNVRWGRYIQAIEKLIYKAINTIFDPGGTGTPVVAKGLNMSERGEAIACKWSRFHDPVAVGIDAKRFDQHINKPLLQFEHSIYRMWLDVGARDDLEPFDWLCRFQLVNKGRYYGKDGKISYDVIGCRMSGDMNTSLGNITIMCALLWSYLRHVKLLGEVEILNDGDDSVIIMERANVPKFLEDLTPWFRDLGLTMTLDGIYENLEEVEFCQARPVKLPEGYCLVPRPSKRLYSDLVTTKPIHSQKVYKEWLGAVAGCGLAGCKGVPVLGAFYKWLGRGATPYLPHHGSRFYRYRDELYSRMEMKYEEPTWESRISFYFAFGITPAAQLVLERYYHSKPDPTWSKVRDDNLKVLDPAMHLCHPEQSDRYADMIV
jgi:hypothetical protein